MRLYRVEKTNVHLYRPVDFGYKMHFRIKILGLHGQHNLQTLIQSQKNVGQIPNFLLKSSKRLRRSELHCAHSSINVGLLCHCSLYGYEFFDNFCLKGLGSLIFWKFQPLENTVPYKAFLIKRKKCITSPKAKPFSL